MLKVCERCPYRISLSYEDLVQTCGKCREVKKADMVDSAEEKPKIYFGGKRWNGGKQSKVDKKLVKALYDEGKTQRQIADLLNVTQPTISNILKERY